MDKYINAPISDEDAKSLNSGDYVYITGTIYTARDAAHKRMAEALSAGQPLPIDMKNNIIYYMGPSPAREGRPIGSAGPTTASRMDKYAPDLLDLGLKGMIGKGKRSQAVIDGIVRNGAVYFAAVGGAGALLSKCIKKSEVISYDDLGGTISPSENPDALLEDNVFYVREGVPFVRKNMDGGKFTQVNDRILGIDENEKQEF